MLVGPVGDEGPRDAVVPPGLRAHLLEPFERDVPVVVDVVVVEQHRRAHRGEQPAHRRLRPCLAVKARVLLEVGDLLPGGLGDVAAGADELLRRGRDLVGVDLVPEHEQHLGPLLAGLPDHPKRVVAQRVPSAAPVVLALAEVERGLVRDRHPAGPEGHAQFLLGLDGPDQAGWKPTPGLGPMQIAVELDVVGLRAAWLEVLDQHQAVVMALDAEGVDLPAEHLDLARLVRFDPDARLLLVDVSEHRPQQ